MDSTLFLKYQPKQTRDTERGILLKEFVSVINKEREGTKWKPVTLKMIAVKVGHLKTDELYFLKSICMDSKNRCGSFSKCFFGSLKV